VWPEPFLITQIDHAWAAGTADMHATVRDAKTLAIVDLKTGASDPRRNPMSPACQLAVYARAGWTWDGHEIVETPDVQTGVGYLLWAPIGEAKCELIPLNLTEGWLTARLAVRVKDHRRNLARYRVTDDYTAQTAETPVPAVPEVNRETLLARLTALVTDYGCTKTDIAEHWPKGVPSMKRTGHTDQQHAEIDHYVTLIEAKVGAYPAEGFDRKAFTARCTAAGTTPAAFGVGWAIPTRYTLNQAETALQIAEQTKETEE